MVREDMQVVGTTEEAAEDRKKWERYAVATPNGSNQQRISICSSTFRLLRVLRY